MWSTGTLKKPWIWPACRSIATTRSTPATSRASATSLAVIGSRGADFLSWREYGNHGTTAVIRFADASLAAWIMISSSPRSTPSVSAMRSASSRFELPENSISRFCGPRSIQRLGSPSGTGGSTVSSPGSVAVSVIGWPSVLVVDVAFLRHLARREARERAWRNVVRYDGTDRDPRVVADLDWCNDRIVDAGPDVAADLRPPLGLTRLMRIVNGDPAGADVRLRADLGVADVGQVRHLCPFSDPRVLQFDERARPCSGLQHGSGAKVTEWANKRSLSDLGIDRDHVRADLGAAEHAGRATQDGKRVDDRVGLELDLRVDPGRQRIDD